ncbi:hypothetical protein JTB14_027642 [Gonioctena quinquepunctata]|nr:hypothetical protein JTB14_027642 [Gonioctena quinquepunctata]
MGYNNSASPWLEYQGGSYRSPYNRPMPQRQRNNFVRRQTNRPQNKPNQNKKGPQKRKQNGSQAVGDKTAVKRKKEEEPQGIQMVIVPGEFPSKAMTNDQLEVVQTSILQEIDNLDDEAFHPQFLDCTKRRGLLLITCNNQESVDWLKTMIETLTPWEEAQKTKFSKLLERLEREWAY